MTAQSLISINLLALLLTVPALPLPLAPSQRRSSIQRPAAQKVTLQVKGKLEQWGNSLVLPYSQKLTFRWNTLKSDTTSAVWQASFLPFPVPGSARENRQRDPDIAASKFLSIPPPGSRNMQFEIMPAELPQLPDRPTPLFIRIKVRNAQGEESVSPSVAIKIEGKFKIAGGNLDKEPLWIELTHIRCEEETNDGTASDEIYVIVYVANLVDKYLEVSKEWGPEVLRKRVFVASGRLLDAPVINNVDKGDVVNLLRTTFRPAVLWKDRPLPDLPEIMPTPAPKIPAGEDSLVILVGLIEHDGSDTAHVLHMVKSSLNSTLYLQTNTYNPGDRNQVVLHLGRSMRRSIDEGTTTITGVGDEIIDYGELRLTAADLSDARAGKVVKKDMGFKGDGGHYILRFQIGKKGTKSKDYNWLTWSLPQP